MSTSLATLRQALSRRLGDYWCSTTTSAGGAAGATLIDTALGDEGADFVSDSTAGSQVSEVVITSTTTNSPPVGETRRISSLTSTGVLTPKSAFTYQVTSAMTYEIHRLFKAADKEAALQKACYDAYPWLYTLIDDTSIRYGNWLRNGAMEKWTLTTVPDDWAVSTVTCAANSTAPYVHSGTYSAKLSTATGYLYTSSTLIPDLMGFIGDNVTFRAWVWSSVASQIKLGIYYDSVGTSTAIGTSSYHTASSDWELLEASGTVPSGITTLYVVVNYDQTGNAYIDDASLVGTNLKRSYDLSLIGLADGIPHQVYRLPEEGVNDTTPHFRGQGILLDNWYPLGSSRIQFRSGLEEGTRLRIVGKGHLTQPTSSVSVNVDAPQTEIIVALAARRLFADNAFSTPNRDTKRFREGLAFWDAEVENLIAKYRMPMLSVARQREA